MENPPANPPGVRTANVQLTVRGRKLGMRISVPDRDVRPAELLPFYRSMSEAMMNMVTRDAAASGYQISCKAGCGACCRQLVPISAVEARHLAKFVEELPEPRRSELKRRFQEAIEKIARADLLPRMCNPQDADPKTMRELNLEYWKLRVPCPFLEYESCSIYAERPIACREFLVVSDPSHCSEDRPDNVRALGPPAGPISHRLPRPYRSPGGKPIDWVPLILSLDFAMRHREEPDARPATQWVGEFFEGLPK